MIKKITILMVAAFTLFACQTLQENYNMVNCKYELLGVELKDVDFNSVNLDIMLGITNLNKKTSATLTRFEGDLYANDKNVAKMTLKDIAILPGEALPVKSNLEIPLKNFGSTLAGLVTMGSVSVTYYIKGTMYFSTPIGEIPFPVTIYQSKR
ncbi:hypothetical protein Dip510_001261 [Elusimicrobium posterum]|uniref:hypothetical protein n=1 Tax=Elusimicrobium posterum TaxID=3116653 RepID=UPI003C79480A